MNSSIAESGDNFQTPRTSTTYTRLSRRRTSYSSARLGLGPLEVDFSPNNNDFVLHKKNIYWSRVHNESSHRALFTRAIETRRRLREDLKDTFLKILASKRSFLHLTTRLAFNIDPEDRFELRLSGYASKSTRISLSAWVWVRCDDKASKRKIRRRLKDLSWLETGHSHVYVFSGPAQLASGAPDTLIEGLDLTGGIKFPDEEELHIHVEVPENFFDRQFTCGRLCCATITRDLVVLEQRISRIGGIFRVNELFNVNTPFNVVGTTAHGMMSFFLSQAARSSMQGDPTVADNWDSSSDEGESDGELSSDDDDDQDNTDMNKEGLTDVYTRTRRWHKLSPYGTINFVAQAKKLAGDTLWHIIPSGFNADYALLKHESHSMFTESLNIYEVEDGESHNSCYRVEDYAEDSDLQLGQVHIVVGHGPAVAAELLREDMLISLHGMKFLTRKLMLMRPLAQGTSGAWVVRQNQLYGTIVAIFDNEPYALMSTAATLFSDIDRFGPKRTNITISSYMLSLEKELPTTYSTALPTTGFSQTTPSSQFTDDNTPPETVSRYTPASNHSSTAAIVFRNTPPNRITDCGTSTARTVAGPPSVTISSNGLSSALSRTRLHNGIDTNSDDPTENQNDDEDHPLNQERLGIILETDGGDMMDRFMSDTFETDFESRMARYSLGLHVADVAEDDFLSRMRGHLRLYSPAAHGEK
ncbi:hypothetical protein F5B20DRAFT_438678 [Whalleya microplaca]|nr:hypothetical protein F5B20DRAFT_438678 [Whalleya microplaca]